MKIIFAKNYYRIAIKREKGGLAIEAHSYACKNH